MHMQISKTSVLPVIALHFRLNLTEIYYIYPSQLSFKSFKNIMINEKCSLCILLVCIKFLVHVDSKTVQLI